MCVFTRESLKAQLAQLEATLAWERSEHATVQRQLADALMAIELTHSEVLAMGSRRADLQAESAKVCLSAVPMHFCWSDSCCWLKTAHSQPLSHQIWCVLVEGRLHVGNLLLWRDPQSRICRLPTRGVKEGWGCLCSAWRVLLSDCQAAGGVQGGV
jgi:hypothetical protein